MAATPPCSPAAVTALKGAAFTKRESVEDAAALERAAAQLESEGQDLASIRNMERALLLRCRDGLIDASCLAAAERLVVKCNTVAVKAFKADDYGTACLLLDNALRLTDGDSEPLRVFDDSRQRLRGTTLNNYGCLERRRGHLQASLQLLTMSLDYAGQQSPATYLNMSAIQSQIGLHEEAVGHARRAIGLLEHMGDNTGMLAIAQHNLATALETLNPTASTAAYEKALQIAKAAFGPNSPTTQSILKNLQRFHQRAKTVKPLTLPSIGNASTTLPDKRRPLSPIAHPFAVSRRNVASDSAGDAGDSAPPHSRGAAGGRQIGGSPRREPAAFPSASPVPPSVSRPQTTEGVGQQRPPMNSALKPKPPTAERAATSTGGPRSRRSSDNAPPAGAPKLRPIKGRLTTDEGKSASKGATVSAAEGLSVTVTSTPRDSDLPASKPNQQQAASGNTPKEGGKPLLSPSSGAATGKSGGTPLVSAASGASEFTEVQPTLPHKAEDLAAFMLSRLGVLLAAEEKFETMFRQVVRIQSLFRCFSSRRQLRRRREERRRQQALHTITLHSASKRIQRFLRSAVKRRLLLQHIAAARNLDSERKSASAIVIQKTARRWLARRIVRAKRTLKRSSARAVVRLQTWFRKIIAVRHAKYLAVNARAAQAATLIDQRRWRAANRIQSSWRACVARDATKDLRGEAFVVREQLRKSKMVLAAIRIQALQRSIMARKVYNTKNTWRLLQHEKRRTVERRRYAAIVLQGFARGIITRRITDPMLAAQRVRAEAWQVARRIAASTRLQSWARMLTAKRLLSERKQQRNLRIEAKRISWLVAFIQRCGQAFRTRKCLPSMVERVAEQRRKSRLLNNNVETTTLTPSVTETAQPADDAVASTTVDVETTYVSAPSDIAVSTTTAARTTEANVVSLVHEQVAPPSQEDIAVEQHECPEPVPSCTATTMPAEEESCVPVVCVVEKEAPSFVQPHTDSEMVQQSVVESVVAPEVEQAADERSSTQEEAVVPTSNTAAAVAEASTADTQVREEKEECDHTCPAVDAAPSEPAADAQTQQQQPIPAQQYPVSFIPRPPRRYSDEQKRAGATIVRVARGCLSRLYSRCVRSIVGEYIDSLVARHCQSSPTRPLAYNVLRRIETDNDVVIAKQRLLHTQEAEQALDKKRHAACVLQRNARVLLAKCKLQRLREERNVRWAERRRDEEEAPVAGTQGDGAGGASPYVEPTEQQS